MSAIKAVYHISEKGYVDKHCPFCDTYSPMSSFRDAKVGTWIRKVVKDQDGNEFVKRIKAIRSLSVCKKCADFYDVLLIHNPSGFAPCLMHKGSGDKRPMMLPFRERT